MRRTTGQREKRARRRCADGALCQLPVQALIELRRCGVTKVWLTTSQPLRSVPSGCTRVPPSPPAYAGSTGRLSRSIAVGSCGESISTKTFIKSMTINTSTLRFAATLLLCRHFKGERSWLLLGLPSTTALIWQTYARKMPSSCYPSRVSIPLRCSPRSIRSRGGGSLSGGGPVSGAFDGVGAGSWLEGGELLGLSRSSNID